MLVDIFILKKLAFVNGTDIVIAENRISTHLLLYFIVHYFIYLYNNVIYPPNKHNFKFIVLFPDFHKKITKLMASYILSIMNHLNLRNELFFSFPFSSLKPFLPLLGSFEVLIVHGIPLFLLFYSNLPIRIKLLRKHKRTTLNLSSFCFFVCLHIFSSSPHATTGT